MWRVHTQAKIFYAIYIHPTGSGDIKQLLLLRPWLCAFLLVEVKVFWIHTSVHWSSLLHYEFAVVAVYLAVNTQTCSFQSHTAQIFIQPLLFNLLFFLGQFGMLWWSCDAQLWVGEWMKQQWTDDAGMVQVIGLWHLALVIVDNLWFPYCSIVLPGRWYMY